MVVKKKRKSTQAGTAAKRAKPTRKRAVVKKSTTKKKVTPKVTRAAAKKSVKRKSTRATSKEKVVKKKAVVTRKKAVKKKTNSLKKVTPQKKKTSLKTSVRKTTKVAKKNTTTLKAPKKTVSRVKKKVSAKQPTRVTKKTVSAKPKTPTHIVKKVMGRAVSQPATTRPAGKRSSEGAFGIHPYDIKEGDTYMDQAQLQHFRRILLAWKQQLVKGAGNTVVHLQEDMLAFPDPVDRASQEENYSLELRTRDRERKLLRKIEQALDMIELGDYGFCEECGSDIGIRRLEARPTATKCIDCKTYEEIRERQGAC